MKIFLDTNIFVRDLSLRSREFEMLFDYLGRSDAEVVFPEIVLAELEAAYLERLHELADGIRRLRSILMEPDKELGRILEAIDFEDALAKYRKYLLKQFRTKDSAILPYDGRHLPEISRRAIQRVPPFSKRGEEFRDALLWLSLLDSAVSSESKTEILISNDRGFASDTGSLNANLAEEAESRSVRVMLYKSIGEFIKARADEIAYITYEWVEQHVDSEDVGDQLRAAIDGFRGTNALLRWLKERKPESAITSSSYQFEGVSGVDLSEFFVYEMADGSHRVNATYCFELDVTYVDYEASQRIWESELATSFPVNEQDVWDYPRLQSLAHAPLRSAAPSISATVYIVVRAGLVESVELDEWWFD